MEGPRTTVTNEELHALADALRQAIDARDQEGRRYSEEASRLLADERVLYPRAVKWSMSLLAYEQFHRDTGRRPRENTRARHTLGKNERHLGEWARYQRRFEDRLNAYQLARLEVSPAFDWDPRGAIWERRLAACLEHQRRTGKLPTHAASDPVEFAHARWLGRQLRSLQTGRLDPQRVEGLRTLLSPNRRSI